MLDLTKPYEAAMFLVIMREARARMVRAGDAVHGDARVLANSAETLRLCNERLAADGLKESDLRRTAKAAKMDRAKVQP